MKTPGAPTTAFSVGRLRDNQTSYLPHQMLADLYRLESGRMWSYRGKISTVLWQSVLGAPNHAKGMHRFRDQKGKESEHKIGRFIEEYKSAGGKDWPSSFACGFHFQADLPKCRPNGRAFFGRRIGGAWQQALQIGRVDEPIWKYDLNSAYGWAATLGLPDPRGFRPCKDYRHDGIFIVEGVCEADRQPPYPFQRGRLREYVVTSDEIQKYKITVLKVRWGIAWGVVLDLRPSLDDCRSSFTDWKRCLQSFWGRWAAQKGPKCSTFAEGKIKKEWRLPNRDANFIWAHIIVSRVKMRLYEISKDALHVFVDSIFLPRTLPTGSDIGEWKLVRHYPNGVTIHRTGLVKDNATLEMEREQFVGDERKELIYVERSGSVEEETGPDRSETGRAGPSEGSAPLAQAYPAAVTGSDDGRGTGAAGGSGAAQPEDRGADGQQQTLWGAIADAGKAERRLRDEKGKA